MSQPPKRPHSPTSDETLPNTRPRTSGRTAFHIKTLEAENAALRADNEALRYENARLTADADLDVRVLRQEHTRSLRRIKAQLDGATKALQRAFAAAAYDSDSDDESVWDDDAIEKEADKVKQEHAWSPNTVQNIPVHQEGNDIHCLAMYLQNPAADADLDDGSDSDLEVLSSDCEDEGEGSDVDMDKTGDDDDEKADERETVKAREEKVNESE